MTSRWPASSGQAILLRKVQVDPSHLTPLVPRVLWLFGQRIGASRDSGVLEFCYRKISAVKQWKSLQGSQSKNLNFFEFPRVSTGAYPLTKKPKDSGYEIGGLWVRDWSLPRITQNRSSLRTGSQVGSEPSMPSSVWGRNRKEGSMPGHSKWKSRIKRMFTGSLPSFLAPRPSSAYSTFATVRFPIRQTDFNSS